MEKIELGMYSIVRKDANGFVEHGLPFVARDHADAKALVYKAMKKDVVKIDVASFYLVRVGSWRPYNTRPIVLVKGTPLVVCNCGEIFGELRPVIEKTSTREVINE